MMKYIGFRESSGTDIETHVNKYVEKENEQGIKVFVLPEGGHHQLGPAGYVKHSFGYSSQ